jgi:hypothetical protein
VWQRKVKRDDMKRLRPLVPLAALLAALASTSPAGAQSEPFGFGQAEKGSLRVVSGAIVSRGSADLRGVWLDNSVGCNQFRSLRVGVLLDRVQGGTTRRIRRSRIGAVRNCAEGGPNFGFTIRARNVGLACPNGRWKPGEYSVVVRTTHRASKVTAVLSLAWSITRPC